MIETPLCTFSTPTPMENPFVEVGRAHLKVSLDKNQNILQVGLSVCVIVCQSILLDERFEKRRL